MDDVGGRSNQSPEKASKRPGWPVDPHRIQRALWAGRFWLVGAAVLGAVVGYLYVKLAITDAYETTAVLKYEGELHIAGLGRPVVHDLGPAAEALRRRSFLNKVRDEMGVDVSLIGLANAIKYKSNIRAGTLHISALGKTPQASAEFVHLITNTFLAYHQDRQARRIEEEIARVADRIEGAEQKAEEARRRYNEFREKHGIAHLSTEQQSMIDSAASLRAESELTVSEIRALEAQVDALETQLAAIPKTSLIGSETSPERAAYNRLREELASARATLSDDHPRVQALQQQVDHLGAKVRGGGAVEGMIGSNATYVNVESQLRDAKSRLTTLRERQKGLSQLADKAQSRVESFSGIEGEASALLAEVEVNEALITKLKATEASLEDALEQPPSGFSVLDPGTMPEYPVANKMKKITFVGVAGLSVLLALVFVLWREFRGFRMRTPAEIAFWGNGPVLGTTAWPSDVHGLDELVAGLDDHAPEAKGNLLIIGGTPGDALLARELAQRMNDDWFVDRPSGNEQTSESSAPQEPDALRTPPPSGPYPIGGVPKQSNAPAQPSTALALQPVKLVRREKHLMLDAWDGPFEGQALRRAARIADRVVVLVRSGEMTGLRLNAIKRRIGRQHGIGYVVLELPADLQTLPDRAGEVSEFWGS